MTNEKNQKELMDRLYDAASKILRTADVNGSRLFEFEADEFQYRDSKRLKLRTQSAGR